MLEKKNLKNDSKCGIYDPIFQFKGSTFNIPGEYHGVQGLQHQQRQFSTCSVFIFGKRKKGLNLCFSLNAEQNIFFTEEVTVQESAKNSATCALCVCCVCVCVIFFDCINTRQSNMTYQLFHGVLLLLHSSHKRRGLLLCGTHILLLVVIIQDAQ